MMQRIEEGALPRWRYGLVNPRRVPGDFEAVFVDVGRLAAQEHYGVGRFTIDHWLEHCPSGKDALIAKRAAHVREKRRANAPRITRSDIQRILETVYPVPDHKQPSPIFAASAARFLQERRAGGFVVTRAPGGLWRIGTRVVTPAELVQFAEARGFNSPSLSGSGDRG